jgi:uroporphyrinogen decarboxylase
VTPRERFATAMAHEQPDRVPVDFGKHFGSFHRNVYPRLRAAFPELDLPQEPAILDRMAQNIVLDDALCRRLGIDFRWVVPRWVNVRDVEVDGAPGYVDMWHTPHKYSDDGGYYAIAGYPLGANDELTLAELEAFDWPDPHDPAMFSGLAAQARRLHEATDAVVGADGIKVGILQTASQLRGYDKLFVDFAIDPAAANALLDRVSELIDEMYREYMRMVGPYVQVVAITDDQGTQQSLMVSPAMFREFIKPRLRSQIEAIKSEVPHVKVLMHSDGAIGPIIDDLIEIGVDILNPIQTSAGGMDETRALKERFGGRLCFHGAIDVQQVLPNATPDGVRNEVARRVDDLGRDGGFILAPCHNINVDIPLENVLTLFEAAAQAGVAPAATPAAD